MAQQGAHEVWYRRTPACPGVEILRAENDNTPWRVYHDRFVFVTVFNGHCVSRYQRHHHDVDARSLSVMVPGESHRVMRVVAPTTFDFMFVDAPYLLKLTPSVDRVESIDFRATIFRAPRGILALWALIRTLVSDSGEALAIEEVRLYNTCASAL
jgi:hypothetical protein